MKHIFIIIPLFALSLNSAAQCTVSVSTTDVTCYGFCDGTATASSTGQPPFTYFWTASCMGNPCTNLCPGTYTVNVTDSNGCSASQLFTITQPSLPLSVTATITQQPSCPTCCDGTGTATASGGTPPYNYSLQPNWPTNVCNGTYTVCVKDDYGCASCDTVLVGPTSANQIDAASPVLMVAPNPAAQSITLDCANLPEGDYEMSVYDVSGKEVLKRNISPAAMKATIDISTLSAGVYYLQMRSGTNCSVAKFIKLE
ncbi:MAG TPA: T9SS type A sorting domain-containing protein [Bacteroidia bacterium]|nr:T9SS type A sorting domain-containing protein [Bacteroidia bacterium]